MTVKPKFAYFFISFAYLTLNALKGKNKIDFWTFSKKLKLNFKDSQAKIGKFLTSFANKTIISGTFDYTYFD